MVQTTSYQQAQRSDCEEVACLHHGFILLTIHPAVVRTSEALRCTAACGHGGSMVTADIVKGTQLSSLIPAHVS